MVSPFPGMDPYLERSHYWAGFHNALATEIQWVLNEKVLPRYVANLESRASYEVVEVAKPVGTRPDVSIWQPQPPAGGPVATLAVVAPPAPLTRTIPLEIPVELSYIEIRKVDTELLVMAIEILSPVHKQRGHEAFDEYRRKRRDMLRSSAHFLEIDLLRGGERVALDPPLPETPYLITLHRATAPAQLELWPVRLQDRLPILPIPLLEPDPDVVLDLQAAVASVYRRGGYTVRIDYRNLPPPPVLSEEESGWVDEVLRQAGKREGRSNEL
jgi:hypothetical protein